MGGEGVYRLLADFPTKFAGAVDVAGYTVNKG
jgi:predicted peptidase